jgi:hypothetical protein
MIVTTVPHRQADKPRGPGCNSRRVCRERRRHMATGRFPRRSADFAESYNMLQENQLSPDARWDFPNHQAGARVRR